eukprot:CAMPEP_0115042330 /NCGR_PEP_ID=MMETSP0216-20121206/46207_1 /TAXON_ID=223996 /ORGANISM="Protocruzia adherens, Strain Boccale" /LENGTH=176 /DNA_ID=CAMNT_0002424435 /DNA_START=597 /DNA_END=1124 /DNA_ORIENTATION=-
MATSKLDSFSPSINARIFSNLVKENMIDRSLADYYQRYLTKNSAKMNLQDLTDFSWGFAKLRVHEREVFKVIEKAIMKKYADLNFRDIPSFLYAFSIVGKGSEDFYSIMEAKLDENIIKMTPKDVCNCIHAFSKIKSPRSKEILLCLSDKVASDLELFNSHELVNVLFSFSRHRID